MGKTAGAALRAAQIRCGIMGLIGAKEASSFRGDAKHRTPMRNCALWNLEIPGLVLRTIPE